ncbi:MAG: hypothetical protein JO019_00350 [Candidatus Kaiserbacteria bacterium]|nr:hypothetical protein [Candidatus Kaiserbacteria bacterium]
MRELLFRHSNAFKAIGALILAVLALYLWYYGYLSGLFYLFGFYVVVYAISKIFKTTFILNLIVGLGGFLFYAIFIIGVLYNIYSALRIMFENSFLWGLLALVIGVPLGQLILYVVIGGIGMILGMPLFWMIEDVERSASGVDKSI